MDIFDKAIVFAVKAHEGQRRKSGGAYITHPLETAVIAATMTNDREVLAAAVLHDTVEDTAVTAQDIEREFGQKVAGLVASETEDKRRNLPAGETWRIRKDESLESLRTSEDVNVKILWLSDKLSNMRSFYREYRSQGDLLWRQYNQQDAEQQHWYYRTVADLLVDLHNTAAWAEYDQLVKRVFESK